MDIINTYHVGYPDLSNLGAAFLVVLVQDSETGLFAVYSGMVRLPSVTSNTYEVERARAARLVATRGSKEPYRRATTYFPQLALEMYNA